MTGITADEIKSEVTRFSPHSEVLTYSTLLAINQNMSVINLSRGGLGKSYCSTEPIKLMEIDHEVIAGHITPYGFYGVLEEDLLTILDESAMILRNKKILDMLLSALWTKKIYWKSNILDEEHVFEGNIIFNTNSLPRGQMMEALKDRLIFNHFKLNAKQIMVKIKSMDDYSPDMSIWKEIKKRINQNKSALDENDKKVIMEMIRNPKSVRAKIRLEKIGRFSKNLVGDLSLLPFFKEQI